MQHPLNDRRAELDFVEDESEKEQALFQPAPAPNSRLERWSLAIGYGAMAMSMMFASWMMLDMAWSGQITSFNLTDELLTWQRVILLLIGLIVGVFSLWLLGVAIVRGKGELTVSDDN